MLYRQVLQMAPDQPDAMRLLGQLLSDRGNFTPAIAILRRLIKLHPQNFAGHYTLGNAYRLSSQLPEAMSSYAKALDLQPGFGGAHHGLGSVYWQARRERAAAMAFRKATEAMPDWAIGWKDLGLALAVLGELAEAEAALQRSVALAPDLGEAQRHLAALRRERASVAELAALAAQAEDASIPPKERIELLFALARQEDAKGEYDAAFRHAGTANKLLRDAQLQAGRGFDRARLAADIDNIIAAFPAGACTARTNRGDAAETPVFILGMPRTGSSLFEQIAASHSQVFGAGEYEGIGEAVQSLGWKPNPSWTPERITSAAQRYLAPLAPQADGALRIIDKMPDNIFQLGLIATLFPQARVVFCARDARDTALSCFFQHFKQPLGYDTDLADCAFRIAQLERLADHWRAVLPLRHLTLRYEDLLASPEQESRRLIEFLGLGWETNCLEFHKSTRVVRTASWSQVRQPIYQHAAGNWRHYAAYLPDTLRG